MEKLRFNKGEIDTTGYFYQLYVLVHCIDRLRENNITEYDISNAEIKYGKLDDVVFNATLKSGDKITTAIQVKHHINKQISEDYLWTNAKTCIYNYFDSYIKIRKTIPLSELEQLILWTNMPIASDIRKWFRKFEPESDGIDILGENIQGLPYDRYRIENYQGWMAQLKSGKANFTDRTLEPEWEDFLKRFVFYVNVPKIDDLKSYLARRMASFDDLCKLVEKCAITKKTTQDQIERLFTLVDLRNSMEINPYAKLAFNDLHGLQEKVAKLFSDKTSNFLHVQPGQDVDCTVARLVSVVEKILTAESKRYLVFSYKTFQEKWGLLKPIINDFRITEIGLKCIIISEITDVETRQVEEQLSNMKVVFVKSKCFVDYFDVNCMSSVNKEIIKNRKIKLSQKQTATANEIFGEELFHSENFRMVLELYKQTGDVLQVSVDEPTLDIHYQSRVAKLISEGTSKKEEAEIDLFEQRDFCKIIISDLPGMGKTLEMIKLVAKLRDRYQDYLVIYLHFRAVVSKWKGNVPDLISNTVTSSSELTNQVIKNIIRLGKVILIMDGYDEVSQGYNDTLKSIVSEISRVQLFRLYIATRPQCRSEIKEILKKCGLCRLEPFSEVQQLNYLEKYWNINLLVDDGIKQTVEKNATCIIHRFRSVKEGTLFIGIPLQTHMIAVIYKDRIESSDFEFSHPHTLGYIYKEFVEHKFAECVKRNYDPTNAAHAYLIDHLWEKFLQDHIEAALEMRLADDARIASDGSNSDTAMMNEKITKLVEKIEHYGLVTRSSLSFVHFSYLEYFLAYRFLNNAIEENEIKNILTKCDWCSDNLVLRFIDDLLGNSNLQSAKKKEFENALHSFELDDIQVVLDFYMCKRMLNIFKTMYTSSRQKVKSQLLKLVFRDEFDCYSNGVQIYCLKNGDQLISLLNILLEDNFILFLLLLNDKMDSILKLMSWRRFYWELAEWFRVITPKIIKDYGTAFQDFLKKWGSRCLELAVEMGDATGLEYHSNVLKNIFPKDKTNIFLSNNKMLVPFIECIENPLNANGNDYNRIKLVHIAIDFYYWAFDNRLPECDLLDAMHAIKSSAVRSAFVTKCLPTIKMILETNQNISLGDQQRSLFEYMCFPDCWMFFELFTEFVSKLNEEQLTQIESFATCRFENFLQNVIETDNVDFLEKAVEWVKNTRTVGATNQFLSNNNILVVLAKCIENKVYDCEKHDKRLKMVHTAFNLYRWSFAGEIPLNENLFEAMQLIQSTVIKGAFIVNCLPTLKILLEKNPDSFITTEIKSLSDQERSIVQRMFNPDFSNLFKLFTEIIPTFKGYVESWMDFLLIVIDTYALQNITNRCPTHKNVVHCFAMNIGGHKDSSSNSSENVKIVKLTFDPCRWTIGDQIPLSSDILNFVLTIQPDSLRRAIVANLLPTFKILVKENPDKFIESFFPSIEMTENYLLELSGHREYLEFFNFFVETFPQLSEEQCVAVKMFIGESLDKVILQAIKGYNVEFLKKTISWLKDRYTKEEINQFLTIEKLLAFFNKNNTCGTLSESSQSQLVEMVHIVFELYRWAYNDRTLLSNNVLNLVLTIRSSPIKRAFVIDFLAVINSSMMTDLNEFITSHVASIKSGRKSLLELLCHRDFVESFDFFSESFSQLTTDQRSHFKDILVKRMNTCLLEIIESNNNELLEKIICWIKDSWSPDGGWKGFLEDNSFLVSFIKSIELGIDNVDVFSTFYKSNDLKVKRIEMVYTVFDMYRWAFNGKIPLEAHFFTALETIEREELKQAFKATFVRFSTKK